jgi:hypothetical protein
VASVYELAEQLQTDPNIIRRELEVISGEWAIRGDTTPVIDEHGEVTPAAKSELIDRL